MHVVGGTGRVGRYWVVLGHREWGEGDGETGVGEEGREGGGPEAKEGLAQGTGDTWGNTADSID